MLKIQSVNHVSEHLSAIYPVYTPQERDFIFILGLCFRGGEATTVICRSFINPTLCCSYFSFISMLRALIRAVVAIPGLTTAGNVDPEIHWQTERRNI